MTDQISTEPIPCPTCEHPHGDHRVVELMADSGRLLRREIECPVEGCPCQEQPVPYCPRERVPLAACTCEPAGEGDVS